MNLLEELVSVIPRGDIPVEEIRVGPFLTAVQTADVRESLDPPAPRCGLASTLAQHEPATHYRLRDVGRLGTQTAEALARYILSDFPLEASLGMATLNAILEVPAHCLEGKPFMEIIVERCRGNRVAVVGHFPFTDRLRRISDKLYVLELRPIRGDLPASKAPEILPTCQVVVISGTVLMNGTYQELLPLCSEAFSIMIGPSTPASPVLFAQGIDMLAGTVVVDSERTLCEVSQGATYRDLGGVAKWVWEKAD